MFEYLFATLQKHSQCHIKISMMNENTSRLSLAEVCGLTGMSMRTVRFYIQKGLVDRPVGERKAAYYTPEHVRQLLQIARWKGAGLSLEAIGALMRAEGEPSAVPVPEPAPGSVQVWSRVMLGPGVELHLDPSRAGLSGEQVRELAEGVLDLLAEMQGTETRKEDE